MYQKVVDYCKKNNMSICQFEKFCGLGNGVVDDWKVGKPSLGSIEKIAAATKIPIEKWVKK